VKLLRRLLGIQAALWALTGILLAAAPGWSIETVMNQPALGDVVWLRILGIASLVLAMLMVMVRQKLEDIWWWAWAFALLEAGTATVFILHALFGVPAGGSAGVFWLLGVVNAAFAAGLLLGLGFASQEHPVA
jgi:hypothetical protein